MSSILGFNGNFSFDLLVGMSEIIPPRGGNLTSVYLKGEDTSFLSQNLGSNFCGVDFDFNLALLSNTNKSIGVFTYEDLVLILDGCLYNSFELIQFLDSESVSDGVLILKLLSFELKSKSIVDAVRCVMGRLDGDYSFALIYKGELILGRDPIGVKPLYYSKSSNGLVFSSEAKALILNDFKDVLSLKPGCFYYKGEIYEAVNLFKDLTKSNKSYNVLVDELISILYKSVYDRVKGFKNIGVLISGGVDSAFITYILNDISKKTDLNFTLYAVGDKNSKDLIFSKKIASDIHCKLKICEVTYELVKYHIEDMIKTIESSNSMKLGVATTIFFATKMMEEDNVNIALSGQGADEIFAGYNRYIKHIEKNKREDLEEELISNLKTMHEVNLERDDKASMINNVELKLPYLSKDLIRFGLEIPTEFKIKSTEDNLKKHILRDAAIKFGVPEEIGKRPKKAAQYGSGIDKILKKKLQKELNFTEILQEYYKL